VIVGLGIAGGLGWGGSAAAAELTPAQIVALRFPTEWNAVPETRPLRVASADGELFSPYPMSRPAAKYTDRVGASAAETPRGTRLAYADPAADVAEPAHTASVAPQPEKRVAKPRPPQQQTTLFNNAQLASIKERLALTADQEPYWPGVEHALRAIGRMKGAAGGKGGKADLGAIDPNSAEVQQLKSAAIPLIMRMREDQKREVRQLARVMGLEQLAAAF
jgi:hypothetical protein